MSADLTIQFKTATAHLQNGAVDKATEQQRWRMYGLSKQAVEGDCCTPSPPASDHKKKWKWEAWHACKGLSKEDAMLTFVKEVEKLDPTLTAAVSAAVQTQKEIASAPLQGLRANAESALSIDGILYKQRDVFKGWRPRYFTLQDVFLHYYLEKDDVNPRKSMDLTGCSVDSIKPAKVGDMEYFPFIVSHPKSTKVYNLAATSQQTAEAWVNAIKKAAERPVAVVSDDSTPSARLLPRKMTSGTTNSEDDLNAAMMNPDATLENIPGKYSVKVETAIETIISCLGTTDGWDQLYEKKGLVAYKKTGISGSAVCVRGDYMVPLDIMAIFGMIYDLKRANLRDPQLNVAENKQNYSIHTSIQYLRYKQVWPTAVRDFCNISHWRMLPDGRIVFVAFSEKFDDICPLVEGNVRGELVIGGFILKATSDGTQCQYIVQSDLKGTIPSSIVNMVSSNQPMVLANIRKALESTSAGGMQRGLFSGTKKYTYEDFIATAMVYYEGPPSVHLNGIKAAPQKGGAVSATTSKVTEDRGQGRAATTPTLAPASTASSDTARQALVKAGKKHMSLYMLFLPALMYYVVPPQYRALAFLTGLVLSLRFLLKQHLGEAKDVNINSLSDVASGRMVIKFPVDLPKLLRYLEQKREDTGVEVTFTHIAMKASAVAIVETPSLNGHMLFGYFYPSRTPGVDVSVALESPTKDTVMMKVVDAEIKSTDYIADEIKTRGKEIREGGNETLSATRRAKVLNALPVFFRSALERIFRFIGAGLGLNIPFLGIIAYPLGVCSVVTLPGGDSDVDICVLPESTDCAAMVTVAIGGIRIQPSYDADKKLSAVPVLSISVTIDCHACSLAEGRKYCARLQQYMNNPGLLDKFDRKFAVTQEDEIIASNAAKMRK